MSGKGLKPWWGVRHSAAHRGNPQFALTRPRLDKITPNTMDHTCEFSCVFVLSQPVFGQLGPRKG